MNMTHFDENSTDKIKSGFKTPDNYFNEFPQIVMQKIADEEKPVISLFTKQVKVIMAVAASLIIGVAVTQVNFSSPTINSVDIENYIAYNSNLTQYDLVNILEEDDINNMSIDYELKSEDITDFLENNPNIDLLINE